MDATKAQDMQGGGAPDTSAFLREDQPFVIAHRCGAGDAPENTISAAKLAIENNARMLQVDCLLSKDNVVVVMHDDPKEHNLSKLTGCDKSVRPGHLNYADFPLMLEEIDAFAMCDGGKMSTVHHCRKIQTLEEFLTAVGSDVHIQLELWDEEEELVVKVAQMLRRLKRTHSTILGHPFSSKVAKLLEKHAPDFPRILTLGELCKLFLLSHLRLLWTMDTSWLRGKIFSVPVVTKRITRLVCLVAGHNPEQPPWRVRLLLGALRKLLYAPRCFAYMRKLKVPTFVWILNDLEEVQQGLSLDVDGIMTDYCQRLAPSIQHSTGGRLRS